MGAVNRLYAKTVILHKRLEDPWTLVSAGKELSCRYQVYVLSRFSPVRLSGIPRTVALQAPLSRGFSRQEYWSGWPFPPPGYLPDPGIEPWVSCISCAVRQGSLPLAPPGKPKGNCTSLRGIYFKSK